MHGVTCNHGYQVVKTYLDVNKTKENIFQMRNPWGHHKYNGKYSLDKPIWTPEMKKLVDWKATEDDKGLFFIS